MLEGLIGSIPDLSSSLRSATSWLWLLIIILGAAYLIPKHARAAISKAARSIPKKLTRARQSLRSAVILIIILQASLLLMAFAVDMETSVVPQERLVIIEIDDFWNLEGGQFQEHGYSIANHESVISRIEKRDFRAVLGATPYIFIEENQTVLALRDDEAMLSYLRSKKAYGHEIAMHGSAHCRNALFCPEYEEQYLNILQGKRELDGLFNQSTVTYLPPGNQWRDPQFENVRRSGFFVTANTQAGAPYRDRWMLITQRGYDVVSRWDWYGGDYGHRPYREWVDAYGSSGLFILQLHCNTFDSQEKLDELERFLDFLAEDNATVVTYEEAYRVLMEE